MRQRGVLRFFYVQTMPHGYCIAAKQHWHRLMQVPAWFLYRRDGVHSVPQGDVFQHNQLDVQQVSAKLHHGYDGGGVPARL